MVYNDDVGFERECCWKKEITAVSSSKVPVAASLKTNVVMSLTRSE